MGSRIEHHAEFGHAVSEVFTASSGEAALRARLEHLGGQHGGLSDYTRTMEGVRYRLIQGIGAEQLPQAVRSLHKGDLIVHRDQTWTPAGEGGYTGTAHATVNGVPGDITARTELKPEDGHVVLRTRGEVTVRIPLLGGKLESVIAEQVTKLLEREAQFIAKWLAEQA